MLLMFTNMCVSMFYKQSGFILHKKKNIFLEKKVYNEY